MRRWTRLAGVLAALVVASLLYLGWAPPSVHAGRGDQGLQGGWAIDDQGKVILSSQLGWMQEAGAGWVRVNFRLGKCFKDWTSPGCNGQTALKAYEGVVTAAQARGLKVLGLLSNESWKGGQAEWTALASETTGGNGDNKYIRAFAEKAARVLAEHFKDSVGQWEVWNEPNAFEKNRGWLGKATGGSYLYPSNFAWLLRRSYDAIKQVSSGATVVSGGIFSNNIGDAEINAFNSGGDYLRQVYARGREYADWGTKGTPFDALGQHVYIDQGSRTRGDRITAAVNELRKALPGADASKRTHVTEVGWTTSTTEGVSPAVQAANLEAAYQAFRVSGSVARAYWFSIQDSQEADLFFGLVDAGGVPKPAFRSYQLFATY